MNRRKKVIILFFCTIILFIVSFAAGCITFYKAGLKNFKVLDVKTTNSNTILYFENNKFATKYDVIVENDNNEIVYEKTVKENSVKLNNLPIAYGEKVNVSVIAYNKKDEAKASTNSLDMVWNEPTFSKNNSYYVAENNDYNLNIDGNVTNSNYYLNILYEGESIYNNKIVGNSNVVPYESLKQYSGRLKAEILKDNKVCVDSYNFYVNTVAIGYVKIDEPIDSTTYSWDDINFKFSGGFGANRFILNIYKNNKLINSLELKDKETKLSTELFEQNTEYKLELVASYNDYEEISKTDSVIIRTGTKIKVNQVYTTLDFRDLKPGSYLPLESKTSSAKILYTTNGKDPLHYGTEYTSPIPITEDVTIKAIAIKNNMQNSEVSTFKVKLGNKAPVVYVSPSKQDYNKGIKGSGYTTEKEMMNKLADLLIPKLENDGIKVIRNNPDGDIKSWTAESRKANADLHLALHSNGSVNHDKSGVSIYVEDKDSLGFSAASLIYKNLYEIYPYKDAKRDYGVVFANGSLAEVHPNNVPVSVLLEVAFHDDMNDALWMVNNLESIASNIAKSVAQYFQI